MNIFAISDARHEFSRQAGKCRSMGSSFVASVLEAVDRWIDYAPITAAMIVGWPGDPAAAGVAMRVNGALHALARRGTPEYLAELYRGEHDDIDGAITAALSQQDQFIANWISHPTQTNEVARAAAIMSALMWVSQRRAMPFDLLELGSSCGLNLNLGRYAYKLGGSFAGDPLSTLVIEPQWRGAPPPVAPVSIATARGVDLNPLHAAKAEHRERLLSFAWADQPARSKRLTEALQIAAEHPPCVDRSDAVVWLAQRLAEPQEAGHCRVVVHAMFKQYLPDRDRRKVAAMIEAAGALATADRPLAWISFEWTAERDEVELRLISWPQRESVVLAKCHPYGDWLDWQALPRWQADEHREVVEETI